MGYKTIHENGKYAGFVTIMSNGDRVRRDAHNNVTARYSASSGKITDGKGNLIGKR